MHVWHVGPTMTPSRSWSRPVVNDLRQLSHEKEPGRRGNGITRLSGRSGPSAAIQSHRAVGARHCASGGSVAPRRLTSVTGRCTSSALANGWSIAGRDARLSRRARLDGARRLDVRDPAGFGLRAGRAALGRRCSDIGNWSGRRGARWAPPDWGAARLGHLGRPAEARQRLGHPVR